MFERPGLGRFDKRSLVLNQVYSNDRSDILEMAVSNQIYVCVVYVLCNVYASGSL